MSAKIVVVGSLNMNLVIRSPRIPAPEETIIGSGAEVVCVNKLFGGIDVSHLAHRLGH